MEVLALQQKIFALIKFAIAKIPISHPLISRSKNKLLSQTMRSHLAN